MKVSDSSRAEGGARRSASGRRVYRQSQSQSSLSAAPVQQVAKVVVPAGMFFAVTFADSFVESGGETPYSKV